MRETKEGKLVHLIFRNDSNGYTVARFETDEEQFSVTGHFHAVSVGARYRIRGQFRQHPKYGEQFQVQEYAELLPDDADGIRRFLASHTIRGIGPKTAKLIVDAFGSDTLRILEESPRELLAIRGIGPKTLERIIESYRESREFAEIALALGELGIETPQAVRIYRLYGSETLSVVRENPYTLVRDVYGMSFRRADALAMRIGIEADSPYRIQSGILYELQRRVDSGSTYVPRDLLLEDTIRLLDVSSEAIEENLVQLAFDGSLQTDVIDEVSVLYPEIYYLAEQRVSGNLRRLMCATPDRIPAIPDHLIAEAEVSARITLSDEQRTAVRTVLLSKVSIVTGGPGTGKTTIIHTIVRILERCGLSVALAAPTGRAAKRITETSGMPAMTIHRLLEYVYAEDRESMEFGRNEDRPLEQRVVIVDEASMVDLLLMDGLLRAIPSGCRLLLVGDVDQLPAVGAGNVLHDMIASDYIPTVRLREIFRQAAESRIVTNAHRINNGEYPEYGGRDSDFFLMHVDGEEAIRETVRELCSGRLEQYYDFIRSGQDIQVITPTRRRALGTRELNVMLQAVLNPPRPDLPERSYDGRLFREGDKVMQIRNNYQMAWEQAGGQSGHGIFNGDIGRIDTVDNDSGKIIVNYDERFVSYETADLNELELAYAMTVHKSQGCEFPVVVMPVAAFPPMLMARNLLYTAVTRGKQLVVLVGSEQQLRYMVDNDRSQERYSGLEARLRALDLGVF